MLDSIKSLIKNKVTIFSTVKSGINLRFKNNILGSTWVILYPIFFLILYSVVYIYILRVRPPGLGLYDYVLLIFSGLVPFLAFSESFGTGTPGIVSNHSLLKNTIFPIELIIVRDVIIGHVNMGIGMLFLYIAIIFNNGFNLSQLLLPIIFVIQIFMVIGIVWISATLAVFFRDLIVASPILIIFLMLLSPIAYTTDMVPDAMRIILHVNPFAWLIQIYRDCLFNGFIPIYEFAMLLVFTISVFQLGYYLITHLKDIFSDYV